MTLFRMAAATLLVLMAGNASAEVATFRVDGEARRAFVYAPPVALGGRLPVVFAFHGRGDDIENFEFVGLHRAWPERDRRLLPGARQPRPFRVAGGARPGRRPRLEARGRGARFAPQEVQHRRQPHLCDRLLEWRGIHVPAVGGTAERICRLRGGGGPASAVCAAEAAAADAARCWRVRSANRICRPARGDRDSDCHQRRSQPDRALRQRMHDLRSAAHRRRW